MGDVALRGRDDSKAHRHVVEDLQRAEVERRLSWIRRDADRGVAQEVWNLLGCDGASDLHRMADSHGRRLLQEWLDAGPAADNAQPGADATIMQLGDQRGERRRAVPRLRVAEEYDEGLSSGLEGRDCAEKAWSRKTVRNPHSAGVGAADLSTPLAQRLAHSDDHIGLA